MNFDREILTYSKNITNVVMFGGLNWLDDVSQFCHGEGSQWDGLITELFKEFWRATVSIIVHYGQDLTEDDICNRIKNTLIDIENEHSPDKVSKSKIKSMVQNKLYQLFLSNIRKLNSEPDSCSFRLILHEVLNEIQGKTFQMVYKNEFGTKRSLYESEFSDIVEKMPHNSNENLVNLISFAKSELKCSLTVALLYAGLH